jgi:hypothetical protein
MAARYIVGTEQLAIVAARVTGIQAVTSTSTACGASAATALRVCFVMIRSLY